MEVPLVVKLTIFSWPEKKSVSALKRFQVTTFAKVNYNHNDVHYKMEVLSSKPNKCLFHLRKQVPSALESFTHTHVSISNDSLFLSMFN